MALRQEGTETSQFELNLAIPSELDARSRKLLGLNVERWTLDTKVPRCYEWCLGRVIDFVAGMTDNYATQVAREIGGA